MKPLEPPRNIVDPELPFLGARHARGNRLIRPQRAIDVASPPFDAGPAAIAAGATKRFQFWYRNPAAGGAGFNLTNALSVTFCP